MRHIVTLSNPNIALNVREDVSQEDIELLMHQVMKGDKGDKGDPGEGENHPYLSLERLRKFLYRVTYDRLPEDNGSDNAPFVGACSSYVKDGKLYRNFDINYDNSASFIVRTADFEGMAYLRGLNDGFINDAQMAELPYRMVDGRNEHGIMVSAHILYNDWSWTGCGNKSINLTRLPLLVLSRVKSMETISLDLYGILNNLYAGEAMGEYLLQMLVTDGETTYAILPPMYEGQPYVIQNATSNPKMTNFRWVASEAVVRTDLQRRPTGVERWNAMPCDLKDLRFTKAYENANRLSEFIGINGTTKDSTDAELLAIYQSARAIYLNRERDGQTWQTMHSVVYGRRMESLYIQEDWSNNTVGGGSGEVTKEAIEEVLTGRIDTHYHSVSKDDVGLDKVPNYDFTSDVEDLQENKQDNIEDLSEIRENASNALQPEDAATNEEIDALFEKQEQEEN